MVDGALSNLDRLEERLIGFDGRWGKGLVITPKIDTGAARRAAGDASNEVQRELKKKPIKFNISGSSFAEIKKQFMVIVQDLERVESLTGRKLNATVQISAPNAQHIINQLLEVHRVAQMVKGDQLNLVGRVTKDTTPQQRAAAARRERQAVQREAEQLLKSQLAGTAKLTRAQQQAQAEYRRTQLAHDAWQRRTVAGMATLESHTNRFVNRLQFLFTAMAAGITVDLLGRTMQEFAATDGAIRGLEITATRFGASGSGMLRELRDDAIGFRHTLQESADALNKLLIGGIRPQPGDVGKLKAMAIGASTLFGTDPSKNIQDIGTGILRLSPRILDNLGLIVRAKDAYAEYGAIIGKGAKDLTGAEKVQAFWNMTMNNAGTEALIAASSLKTTWIMMQQGKTVMADLRLAFGEVIAAGFVPLIEQANQLEQTSLMGIARFTTWGVQTGLLSWGLISTTQGLSAMGVKMMGVIRDTRQLTQVTQQLQNVQMMGVALAATRVPSGMQMSVNAWSIANLKQQSQLMGQQQALQATGALTAAQQRAWGVGIALTAVVAAAAAAYQDYSLQLAKANAHQLDAIQSMVQYDSYLKSVNLRRVTPDPQVEGYYNKLNQLPKDTRNSIMPDATSTMAYIESLQAMADKADLSSEATDELKGRINSLIMDGLDKYVTHAAEMDAANGKMGLTWQQLATLVQEDILPAVDQAYREMAQAQADSLKAQEDRLFTFRGTASEVWSDIGQSLLVAVGYILDTIAALVKASIGSILVAVGTAAMAIGDLRQMAAGKGGRFGGDTPYDQSFVGPLPRGKIYNNDTQQWAANVQNAGGRMVGTSFGAEGGGEYGFGLGAKIFQSRYDALDKAQEEWRKKVAAEKTALTAPDVDTTTGKAGKKKKEPKIATAGEVFADIVMSPGFQAQQKALAIQWRGAADKLCAATGAAALRMLGFDVPNITFTGDLQKYLQGIGGMSIGNLQGIKAGDFLFWKEKGPLGGPKHTAIATSGVERGVVSYVDQDGKTEKVGIGQLGSAYRIESQLAAALPNFQGIAEDLPPFLEAYGKFVEELGKLQDQYAQTKLIQDMTGDPDRKALEDIQGSMADKRLEFSAAAKYFGWDKELEGIGVDVGSIGRGGVFGHARKKREEELQKREDLIKELTKESETLARNNKSMAEFGLTVDQAEVEQANYQLALKIINSDLSKDEMGKLFDTLPGVRAAFKKLGIEAERQARQMAVIDFRSSLMDFEGRLAMAKEPDSNRDAGLAFNALYKQALLDMETAMGMDPQDKLAPELFKKLQDELVELYETASSMTEFLTPSGKTQLKSILEYIDPQLRGAMDRLDPGAELYSKMRDSGSVLLDGATTAHDNMVSGSIAFKAAAAMSGKALGAAAGIDPMTIAAGMAAATASAQTRGGTTLSLLGGAGTGEAIGAGTMVPNTTDWGAMLGLPLNKFSTERKYYRYEKDCGPGG